MTQLSKAIAATSALVLISLSLSGCRQHDFPQYPANYREYVYVSNGQSNTVTVLDVVNLRLDRELAVGVNPLAVLPNPVKNEVYVLNGGQNGGPGSISVINAEHNAVEATIPVGAAPVSLEVSSDGKLAYVANSGSNSVSVVDLKGRRELSRIGVGEAPSGTRISPDRHTLVVTNRQAGSVTLVQLPTADAAGGYPVRAVFSGCPGASSPVVLPDSSKAFVACAEGHQILSIQLARAAQPASQQAPALAAHPDRLESILDVGQGPVELALKPDGGELFVLNSKSGSISEVATGAADVGGAYMIGNHPIHGIVSADNSTLYVSNIDSQYVTLYAIDDGKRAGSVHVGDGPSALTFSAARHLLFVVDTGSNDVAAIRTSNHSLFTLLPAGRGSNAIADKSFQM